MAEKKVKDTAIYEALLKAVANLPKEAIEKATKEITRKGYDTTGYQYQFLVNVLNEVLGLGGWSFKYAILKELEGAWSSGKKFWEITVDVNVILTGIGEFNCIGGHKAELHADALKGAITNGFKKTVAFFGVGKKAYEGTIDEDYRPLPNGKPEQKAEPIELSKEAKEYIAGFEVCTEIKQLEAYGKKSKPGIDKLPKKEEVKRVYAEYLVSVKRLKVKSNV